MLKLSIVIFCAIALVQAQQSGKLDDADLDSLIDGVLSKKDPGAAEDVPKVSHRF